HLVVVGRGRVVADASVPDLLATAAGGRVSVRTASAAASMVLTDAGGTVTERGTDTVTGSGLPAERVGEVLTGQGGPVPEVSAYRATLEAAYLELTRDAVEFRAPAVGLDQPGRGLRAVDR